MQNSSWRLRRLCVMAVLCAMAFAAVSLVRIPVVAFLKYEPKDVLLVIGGFLFGPLAGALMATLVGLLEMVTVSDTGIIGCVMNILSSCLFVCTASAIYQQRNNLSGAVMGLIAGSFAATAGMLLWNYLITPIYMHLPRETIVPMLPTVFLPFNLLKTALNSTLAMLLYKSVTRALRRAHLLPTTTNESHSPHHSVPLIAAFILLTLIAIWLVWRRVI